MDIQIFCNTDDEQLFANIEANSKLPLEWVKSVEAHDGHAVIVGGGPSAADQIESIRRRQSLGQTVFALNGAAEWLYKQGVRPDFQVVVDARAHNKRFVRYPWAKTALLASQCDQSLFMKEPSWTDSVRGFEPLPEIPATRAVRTDVKLWHPVIEGITEHIQDDREFALVGGGTTVGLSAMALAYTMGYRKMHLYGYDSCHAEGKGHAYAQPENATEPDCKVTVFGKTFRASLAMAKQAEFFPELCNNLIDMGCVITCDGDGLIPWILKNNRPMTEAQKYEAMWSLPAYRTVAPGECVADAFINVAQPSGAVIDFGCGTGRGALRLRDAGLRPICVDFVNNSRDPEALSLPFVLWDFSSDEQMPVSLSGVDYGFCTDVMEHIPPERVDAVINNLMRCTGRVFFQISTVPDQMGALIGQQLHLTVQPHQWWADKFASLGYAVEWSQEEETAALFYVTTHKET